MEFLDRVYDFAANFLSEEVRPGAVDKAAGSAKSAAKNLLGGSASAIKAVTMLALESPALIQTPAFRSVLIPTVVASLIAYVMMQAALIPARFLFLLLHMISFGIIPTMGLIPLAPEWLSQITSTIPIFAMFVLRFFRSHELDLCFFTTLDKLDPALAKRLKQDKPIFSSWAFFISTIIKFSYLLVLSLAAWILIRLPLVGFLVAPLIQFRVTVKTVGFKLALALSITMLLQPWTTSLVLGLVNVWRACILLGLDMLSPFLSRRVPISKLREFANRHQLKILSFAMPFSLLFAIPILGPLFGLLVAISAAPVLLVDILDDDPSLIDLDPSKHHRSVADHPKFGV